MSTEQFPLKETLQQSWRGINNWHESNFAVLVFCRLHSSPPLRRPRSDVSISFSVLLDFLFTFLYRLHFDRLFLLLFLLLLERPPPRSQIFKTKTQKQIIFLCVPQWFRFKFNEHQKHVSIRYEPCTYIVCVCLCVRNRRRVTNFYLGKTSFYSWRERS